MKHPDGIEVVLTSYHRHELPETASAHVSGQSTLPGTPSRQMKATITMPARRQFKTFITIDPSLNAGTGQGVMIVVACGELAQAFWLDRDQFPESVGIESFEIWKYSRSEGRYLDNQRPFRMPEPHDDESMNVSELRAIRQGSVTVYIKVGSLCRPPRDSDWERDDAQNRRDLSTTDPPTWKSHSVEGLDTIQHRWFKEIAGAGGQAYVFEFKNTGLYHASDMSLTRMALTARSCVAIDITASATKRKHRSINDIGSAEDDIDPDDERDSELSYDSYLDSDIDGPNHDDVGSADYDLTSQALEDFVHTGQSTRSKKRNLQGVAENSSKRRRSTVADTQQINRRTKQPWRLSQDHDGEEEEAPRRPAMSSSTTLFDAGRRVETLSDEELADFFSNKKHFSEARLAGMFGLTTRSKSWIIFSNSMFALAATYGVGKRGRYSQRETIEAAAIAFQKVAGTNDPLLDNRTWPARITENDKLWLFEAMIGNHFRRERPGTESQISLPQQPGPNTQQLQDVVLARTTFHDDAEPQLILDAHRGGQQMSVMGMSEDEEDLQDLLLKTKIQRKKHALSKGRTAAAQPLQVEENDDEVDLDYQLKELEIKEKLRALRRSKATL